jgi:hypothetical protein
VKNTLNPPTKEIAMSVQTIAGKFIDLCNEGKHFEVMRTMYAPEMVSVEGDGKETVGKEPVIRKSEVFQGNHILHGQKLRGAFFCGDPNAKSGKFAVYSLLDYTPKAGGERRTQEEVGLYTVNNDRITREEFFYAGHFI